MNHCQLYALEGTALLSLDYVGRYYLNLRRIQLPNATTSDTYQSLASRKNIILDSEVRTHYYDATQCFLHSVGFLLQYAIIHKGQDTDTIFV